MQILSEGPCMEEGEEGWQNQLVYIVGSSSVTKSRNQLFLSERKIAQVKNVAMIPLMWPKDRCNLGQLEWSLETFSHKGMKLHLERLVIQR